MVRSALTQSKRDLVCCLDMGTSHIKAALIDESGHVVALSFSPVPHRPAGAHPSEFNAADHFRVACQQLRHLARSNRHSAERVKAIAVTGQRASIVPVYHNRTAMALGWSDTRGTKVLQQFWRRLGEARFRRITGLQPSTLWSLAKILSLQQAPRRLRPARFALLNDYILWKLGAPGLITDTSSASLTGLLDIRRLRWSPAILRAAGLSEENLPALAQPGTIVGSLSSRTAIRCGLPAGTPLVLAGGDQQCADLGMGVLDATDTGICLGTAGVLSCPTKRLPSRLRTGIFCTAHVVPDRWVLEGIHKAYGSALEWVGRVLNLATPFQAVAPELFALEPLFLPFLAGMGSPDFDPAVRGSFVGLDAAHGPQDLARGVVLGNALELRRIFEAMGSCTSRRRVTITGGETRSRDLVQTLADISGFTLRVSSTHHATLLGAALLAWTGTGRFQTLRHAVRACVGLPKMLVSPRTKPSQRDKLYARYVSHVDAIRRTAHA